MRAPLLTSVLLLAAVMAAPLVADAQPRRGDDVDARTLTAEQIQRYAATYYPAIKACYLEFGQASPSATGELALELVVHRDGYIHDVVVDAPGVRGPYLRRLEGCVRMQVLGWHFPVRRDFTTAILPYYFMYLDIPGAGPQESCWNPRGCFEPGAKAGRPAKPATPAKAAKPATPTRPARKAK